MLLLNFSHPLTNEHLAKVETLTGKKVDRVIEVNSQIDPQRARPRGAGSVGLPSRGRSKSEAAAAWRMRLFHE